MLHHQATKIPINPIKREFPVSGPSLQSLRFPRPETADTRQPESNTKAPPQQSPTRLQRLASQAKSLGISSLRFAGDALMWSGDKLRALADGFVSEPTPQGPVDALLSRATSGAPDSWQPPLAPVGRSLRAVVTEACRSGLSLLQPSFIKESRKIMGYETGILKKSSAVLAQIAKGLPNRAGTHITPERIRALPHEYNDPHLQKTFHQLRREYFPKRSDLDDYKVVWRDRPMHPARGKVADDQVHGYIVYGTRTIHIGREMSHPDAKKWIPALIHHELSHAVLDGFLSPQQDAHDEWFKRLNLKHPDARGFLEWRGWHDCFRSYHQPT